MDLGRSFPEGPARRVSGVTIRMPLTGKRMAVPSPFAIPDRGGRRGMPFEETFRNRGIGAMRFSEGASR